MPDLRSQNKFPRDQEGGYIEVPDQVWQPSPKQYSSWYLQRVLSLATFRTLAVLWVCLVEEW